MNDARNPHYGTCSSIQFQDGPETYSGAEKQGAFREGKKNDFVSLHAISSALRKSVEGRSKYSVYY